MQENKKKYHGFMNINLITGVKPNFPNKMLLLIE